MTLADEPIRNLSFAPDAETTGRRLRVFIRLVRCGRLSTDGDGEYRIYTGNETLFTTPRQPAYSEALRYSAEMPHARDVLRQLPLRPSYFAGATLVTSLDQVTNAGRNAEVPDALQDLAEEIALDVHEACAAFDDPEIWYPGVDEGIEPVPDEHVSLVIAAMQRELDRELRNPQGQMAEPRLPAAPLNMLPWRVQRALAERRRLRFAQYGIRRPQWESGIWSLWDVSEDDGWRPRRLTN